MTLLQAVKDYRVVRDFFEKPIQTGAMIGAISIIATAALSLYANTLLLATTGQGLLATNVSNCGCASLSS